MPTWYHRASWALLKALYSGSSLKEVRAAGAKLLPEPPFLLLADHSNALDGYAIGSFSKSPIRYMANIEGVHPAKALLAGLVGVYGRRKGASDIAALRRTISLAKSGEAIGIFPEGDRSWDGASTPIRPGAGRLAKRLAEDFGLPLVLARQKGNYLVHPRWAVSSRRGRWDIEFLVYDPDELSRMSEGLVEAVVATAIAKNEIKDALAEGRYFSGNGLAEGIGRLLWRCPVCGKADAISGRDDKISCGRCGARWKLDANCRVTPINAPLSLHAAEIGDLKDWHDWQVATLPELAANGNGRGLASEGVILSRRTRGGLHRIGRGRLFWPGRSQRGTPAGELVFETDRASIAFDARLIRGFVDNFNSFSEFDHRGERWRVEFGGGNAAKWSYAFSNLGGAGPSGGEPRGDGAAA
jgi:1-acyl-sn-glycerol-3-phosphate acyltransferase